MAEHADTQARARALDPNASFIVRAPAGAGKTELLVQRYLALLATVTAPEAIVAITFTIKAAGEMRARILAALELAQRGADANSEHGRHTLELARAALERDRARGWRIVENPARLQIQTIDALCLKLARRMPVLARTQGDLHITERPRPLYRAAARMLLDELEEPEHGEQLATLLLYLDGDERKLLELIADMLDERDRWLRHVLRADATNAERAGLEANLAVVVREALESIAAVTPPWLALALPSLAVRVARTLAAAGANSPIRNCATLTGMPPPLPDTLPAWLGIAELLLTASGELRRQPRLNDGQGGSGLAADDRPVLQGLLKRLAESRLFASKLKLVRTLPNPVYDDIQWAGCAALLTLLPRAAACLKVVFGEAGALDFTEIAHAALRALGDAETPTDLALALDQRIEHLLVDEFQDTSFTQFELLTRLTAGWSRGDGRSLFLVGDPMQSIYRFREAEVALFARVEQRGLGAVTLQPLRLTRNFRAQAGLVDWVNDHFAMLFPPPDERAPTAVQFAAADATCAPLAGAAVSLHAEAPGDYAGEAHAVVELIASARREQPQARIAVLARAREHLAATLRELGRVGLPFRAVDVQPLAQVPIVQDLHALTRALLHLGDRVAWLAILRAPWCGLTLADLHALAHAREDEVIWEAVVDEPARAGLSEDGRRRLSRCRRVLGDSLADRGRHTLRRWVEGTWTALGGRACMRSDHDWANARRYLRLLEELDRGGEPARLEELDEALAELYADPDPSGDERLQLMTIHRSKGLEFDVVIVPSLGRAPGRRSERLLTLLERVEGDESRLLVAPMSVAGQPNAIGRYLQYVEESSDDEEAVRLLYVAATRARSRLHLLGAARMGASGMQPRRDSLLARLWPAVCGEFAPSVAAAGARTPALPSDAAMIWRLPAAWVSPGPPAGTDWQPTVDATVQLVESPEFEWAGDVARHVGRTVHRALERIARDGVAHWESFGAQGQRQRLSGLLRELGVPRSALDGATERAHRAVRNTLLDERGRWLLAHAHADARSEYELAAWIDGRLVAVVLDRTFVDDRGVRWIVDFKAGVHEGAGLEAFIDEEVERYRPQLERYATVLRRLDTRPLRVGLYFPLLSAWREWAP